MTDNRTERRLLDAIASDDTAPKVLRQAITKHLDIYDRTRELRAQVMGTGRELGRRLSEARHDEPGRIIDALTKGHTLTADDISTNIELIERALRLSDLQHATMTRTLNLAWNLAERRPFTEARAEVLPWIASHRTSTPWDTPLPDHLNRAWRLAARNYLWQVPMMPKRHRFTRLDAQRPTEAMRRTWHLIGTSGIQLAATDDQQLTYRVIADWPDLLDDDLTNA